MIRTFKTTIEIDVEVKYEMIPGEEPSFDSPGCLAEVELLDICPIDSKGSPVVLSRNEDLVDHWISENYDQLEELATPKEEIDEY